MPRKKVWYETVVPWTSLDPRRWYQAEIMEVQKAEKSVRVTLELMGPANTGQRHQVVLPLPISPGNLTARFLTACGVAVEVDRKVSPQETAGKTIGVRFALSDPDKPTTAVDFKAVNEEGDRHEEAL